VSTLNPPPYAVARSVANSEGGDFYLRGPFWNKGTRSIPALREVDGGVDVAEENVVVGVAGNKFIEKSRSEIGGQFGDETGGWSDECGVGVVERCLSYWPQSGPWLTVPQVS